MTVAVFDIGKTNLKLHMFDAAGRVVAQRSRPNRSLVGPPWLHPDLAGIEAWLLAGLAELAVLHPVEAFVATAHGSGGVLVDEAGPVLPAIDYEDLPPTVVRREYARIAPPFPTGGAAVQDGATHLARQLLWMERSFPQALARARHFLPLPQYWAWRLTGRAVLEPTMLGAQSHLWNSLTGSFTPLVDAMGWRRLFPELVSPGTSLGSPRPGLGLPGGIEVLAGVHDSTANLYGYQAAGLTGFALLSTGTWLVGLCPDTPASALIEAYSMTVNSDVAGRPVAGALAMTGRDYAELTGGQDGQAQPAALAAVLARRTLALPGFSGFDSVFPGSAGRGKVVGRIEDEAELVAVATLYAALTADVCLDLLQSQGQVVIDGSFAADPAFAALVAALRPGQKVLVNRGGGGTAAGAALLWTHGRQGQPVQLDLSPADLLELGGLDAYRAAWRAAVEAHLGRPLPPPARA